MGNVVVTPYYADDAVTVYAGDCLDVLRELPDNSVDAVCTDPPYGLEFMGREWDTFGDVTRANRGTQTERKRPPGESGTAPKHQIPAPAFDLSPRALHAFQKWCEEWAALCWMVLKPGGHMLAFGGSRTWHRLACAVEDAGFEIRDSIAWLHAQGFPKSLNIGNGLGTALKPAFEPVVVARKPLSGTVASNVTTWGTGALNIAACRVEPTGESRERNGEASQERRYTDEGGTNFAATPGVRGGAPEGRWPTNVVLDDSQAADLDRQSGAVRSAGQYPGTTDSGGYGGAVGKGVQGPLYDDQGGASRFFVTYANDDEVQVCLTCDWRGRVKAGSSYAHTCRAQRDDDPPVYLDGRIPLEVAVEAATARFRYVAKAPTDERPRADGVAHPTVKPLDLMRWLVRLVTPPGGVVLDPFAGSGTTAEACVIEGFRCITIEREASYLPLIEARLSKPIQPDIFGGAA